MVEFDSNFTIRNSVMSSVFCKQAVEFKNYTV